MSIGRWEDQFALEGREAGTPSFHAIQLLLACEVGLPAKTMAALTDAIMTIDDEAWTSFATAVQEHQPVGDNAIVVALGGTVAAQRFILNVRAVLGVTADILRIRDLRLALTVVSKFSFRSRAVA